MGTNMAAKRAAKAKHRKAVVAQKRKAEPLADAEGCGVNPAKQQEIAQILPCRPA